MRSDSHGTSNYHVPSPNYKLEVNGPIVGRFSAGDIVIASTQIGFSTVNISYSKVVSIVLGQGVLLELNLDLKLTRQQEELPMAKFIVMELQLVLKGVLLQVVM